MTSLEQAIVIMVNKIRVQIKI